ncbi:DUF5133 domain-containing protein [Streptomyces sp. NPDC086787]|uniref:DUF5133 domain-containing protein n=1 Tax=Streptomyces sp. NPDC086787 TaxID=3365759 RepID=UPI00380EA412
MLLPAEKELRSFLARFADVRVRHDLQPTGQTSRELEDITHTLGVMAGTQTTRQALTAADAQLERLQASGHTTTGATPVLAARPRASDSLHACSRPPSALALEFALSASLPGPGWSPS